jgi:hypothetical protein
MIKLSTKEAKTEDIWGNIEMQTWSNSKNTTEYRTRRGIINNIPDLLKGTTIKERLRYVLFNDRYFPDPPEPSFSSILGEIEVKLRKTI